MIHVSQLLFAGCAFGLFLYAFGIFIVIMFATSLRTNAVIVVALGILIGTIFCLAAGNYGATVSEIAGHGNTLIHWGGYTGLAAAALAFYLAFAELCEFSYHRAVLPVWPLSGHRWGRHKEPAAAGHGHGPIAERGSAGGCTDYGKDVRAWQI